MIKLSAFLGLLIGAASCWAQETPVRVLFLTGETDLPYHRWRETTPFLRSVLANTGRFDVKVLEEPRGLTSQTLAGFNVLALNYNGPRWGQQSEAAVEEFVRSGGGMIALHGVSYGQFFGMEFRDGRWRAPSTGDRGWAAYADMMGQTWKPENIGHAVRHAFTVKWVDREHPVSRGLEPTFLANDELYHKMDLKPNAHVLATAYSDPAVGGTGQEEPQIWTVPFGKGRVIHITLGHDPSAMYQPGFLAAFARGTQWAATGKVTLPAQVSGYLVPKKDAVRVLVVTGGHSYPTSFLSLFEGYDDIRWSQAASQAEAFRSGLAERYDVIALHDMANLLGEAERKNLREFVEAGKGVVETHHAIVDYTDWPYWWEEVIGGKYFEKPLGSHEASHFKDDVEMVARPVKAAANHPVIRGLGPLPVVDEAYRGMWISPKSRVLMEVESSLNDRPVVYIGPHPKARVVYIQFGHGESTHRHPGYRKLVHNAILWSAGRLN